MPRRKLIFCSGICLLITAASQSQILPQHPTAKQVVGYHFREQQLWEMKQLPTNSVLFKYNYQFTAWQPRDYIEPGVFPGSSYYSGFRLFGPTKNFNSAYGYLHTYLKDKSYPVIRPARVWKDPAPGMGSQVLREIITSQHH